MPNIEVALRRIVVGYRVLGAFWLASLGIAAIVRDTPQRPSVVLATIVVAIAWAGVTVAVSLRALSVFRSWTFVTADVAVSAAILLAPDVAGVADFYGGYPMSSVFVGAFALGLAGAVASTVTLSVIALLRALGPGNDDFGLMTSVVVYPFAAAAAAWAMGVLRQSDRLRREAEKALAAERSDRVRAEERADIAAHLHDSVLQSLALIQRDPTDAEQVTAVARRQERELRNWLFGSEAKSDDLRDAVAHMITEIEDHYRVHVDAVVVGDGRVDQGIEALLGAMREAIINAARHAGVASVSLYVELDEEEARAFVRDRGAGFDIELVEADRQGVRQSIVGRMERAGGRATVRSSSGRGTEVELQMPLRERSG